MILEEISRQKELLFLNAERDIAALPNEIYEELAPKYLDLIGSGIESLLEDAIHNKSNGPYFLAKERLSKIVIDSWLWIANTHGLFVYAICVMSNHVHVILRGPLAAEPLALAPIIQTHKSFTATMCNRVLDRTGTPFWSKHYFDRDIREGRFSTVMWYVLNNPVKAGLVDHWREWHATWLHPDYTHLFR